MRTQQPLRVTVLAGGPDGERDVSLASGRAVASSLRDAGHDVRLEDALPTDLSALDVPCDVVFPAMHGAWGEGGPLQVELEKRGLAYVGSEPDAAAIAMDKVAAKKVWEAAGIPVPRGRLVGSIGPVEVDHDAVIKPIAGGSSLDVFVRHAPAGGVADVAQPIAYLLAKYGRCMVEELVVGHEMTVGVLLGEALPPIWIDTGTTANGWFDYNAKYRPDGAAHRFELPPGVSQATVRAMTEACVEAGEAIGCRDLYRADVIVRADGTFALLEINTMPGCTGRSLLPDAAREAGIEFAAMCDRLVQAAAARRDKRSAERAA